MSEWIEISALPALEFTPEVSLFMSEWIEIDTNIHSLATNTVSLFMSEWIEISAVIIRRFVICGLTLYE